MLIKKLKEQNNFSKVEKMIADYILNNPQTIISMSIRDLAKKTYSSPATILRLCKKVDVSGYQEFRTIFNSEISSEIFNPDISEDMPFKFNDTLENIANNIASINIRGIQDTLKSFDYNNIQSIINELKNKEIIDIYGDGSSLLSANEFRLKMLRLGIKVQLEENFSNQCYQAVNSNSKHIAIIISHSGESLNSSKILKILKKSNITSIAITADLNSTIAKGSDYIIKNGSYEDLYLNKKLEMYSSHTSVHFILDCLYSFLYLSNYDEYLKKSIEKELLIHLYSTDKN